MNLREAAKTVANGTHRIGVYGSESVECWQVEQIAREWLALTETVQVPSKKQGLWKRLLSGKTGSHE